MEQSKAEAKSSTVTYSMKDWERKDFNMVVDHYIKGRSVSQKNYNQFNGRNLQQCIDDWQKRWNGYIPAANPLLGNDQSRIFLNITRNIIISYLSKVAMQPPKSKIKFVNKKSKLPFQKLSEAVQDMNTYSLNNENGDARFFETALECTIKGTIIKYEGYARDMQSTDVIDGFDPLTGEAQYSKRERVIFDDCFQETVPLEDFFIANPYQPDIQKQPWILWRKITTKSEAEREFGHYKNFKFVKEGSYTVTMDVDPGTFYRNALTTTIEANQVEIVRYYSRTKNKYVAMINGIIMYSGPIPFKHGKYPFAKTIFEPFDTFFFWGAGFPNKIMGEQDLANTFWNMMAEKTFASLLPFGLSSDLDDFIEDDVLELNKIRKVGDINKWKFVELPGITSGETTMLSTVMNFIKENAGTYGGGSSFTPRGGKMQTKQVMLQQQEAMQKIGFSASFLEDFERDRTELRVSNILQFYSIPRFEKITGADGKEFKDLKYREVKIDDTVLSDGKTGTKILRLVGGTTENERAQLKDELSVIEEKGAMTGTQTEAMAIDVDTFDEFTFDIQVLKNSSFEKNQVLDQAVRKEYVDWRMQFAQMAPLDVPALMDWVDESYDIAPDQFKPKQKPGQAPPASPQMPPGGAGTPDTGNVLGNALKGAKKAQKEPAMGM